MWMVGNWAEMEKNVFLITKIKNKTKNDFKT
jgi:hypothetical protein